ncbi:hypothetical protein DB346_08160 [Verrucomicrobia bacterium LW23]|nr:hypothetical protein DB346_08160 [Verrucomicrobia bacterium LW23]
MAGAASEIINLFDFSDGGPDPVEDVLGRPFALTKVKGLIVQVTSATASASVELGGEGSSAAWKGINGSGTVKIADVEAGTPYLWFNRTGKDVTDATDHLLKLLNSHPSASVTVAIFVLGSQ